MAGFVASESKSSLQVAVLSAIASIAVALIGILPVLLRQEKVIEDWQRKNGVIDSAPAARLTIHGTLTGAPGDSKVYLVPGNGNNYLTVPDDNGEFRFEDVFPGPYWILVQSEANGVTRWLISPRDSSGTRKSSGATLEYRVERPGEVSRTADGSS